MTEARGGGTQSEHALRPAALAETSGERTDLRMIVVGRAESRAGTIRMAFGAIRA
jgi:hypothetical protein